MRIQDFPLGSFMLVLAALVALDSRSEPARVRPVHFSRPQAVCVDDLNHCAFAAHSPGETAWANRKKIRAVRFVADGETEQPVMVLIMKQQQQEK